LEYIETKFRRISPASYYRRKSFLESDHSVEVWLNNFTRLGFVQLHKELLDNVKMILGDSNRRLAAEKNKTPRNEYRIDKLKEDIRKSVLLYSELSLGTPIVAQIRGKLAEKEKHRIIPIQANGVEDNENESNTENENEDANESLDSDSDISE
jgi:hypothetical protein